KQDYARTLYQLDAVPEARRIDGPTFTFAHLYLPHEPYVFDADGRYVTKEEQDSQDHRKAYVEQLKYTNKKITEMVDEILDVPDEDRPIVILQSDEGPGPDGWNPKTPEHFDWTKASQATLEEKFRLLNAYYLPDIGEKHPPDDISPVNSFRWLLSTYFGADLEPLDARSYIFRNELEPYRFVDVTERVKD
ncbi:MAG: sulfatase-like hydrolase/transferase, partial [Actinomycetota bacterium]